MRRVADQAGALEPVSVPSAAEVVVAQLIRAIQLGRFLPGDQLPPEREFAVQLGVSRVTLRAALQSLEMTGLLERARRGSGGGALVVAAAAHADAGQQALREHLEEVCEFRVACESAAAELAAARRSATQLDQLREAIAALDGELTPGAFRAADNDFHLGIADAAGNRLLRNAVEDARAAMFGPLQAIDFELVVRSAVEQHRRILEAIAAGDGPTARAAMVGHIRDGQQEVIAALAVAEPRASDRSD